MILIILQKTHLEQDEKWVIYPIRTKIKLTGYVLGEIGKTLKATG
jgi:hypothetical protein